MGGSGNSMHILVVNDDGIDSPGLKLLTQCMAPFGKVSVVAPHTEQSAIGHGITIHEPIRLHHRDDLLPGIDSWSLEGKPADCVKFALYGLNLKADLVVSGINNGPNLGTDILYSGTLAGASEGIVCGIPSIAVSADFGSLELPRKELPALLQKVMNARILDPQVVININFPQARYPESRGLKITDMGQRPFLNKFVEEEGKYWARGNWAEVENAPETDVWAWEKGYVSLTPIQINRTDYSYMKRMEESL